MLNDHKLNPYEDIYYNTDGVIQLKPHQQGLIDALVDLTIKNKY